MLQRIEAIDAKITPLHSQAKERLSTGIATDLSQGAALLELATTHAQKIRTSTVEENQRHGAAMSKLIAAQQELECAFHEGVSTSRGCNPSTGQKLHRHEEVIPGQELVRHEVPPLHYELQW